MKAIISVVLIFAAGLTNNGEFCKGFADGHCEGWKDVKGQMAVCPVPPTCPVPYPDTDSYKGGYNLGFKTGVREALKNDQ